MNFYLDAITNFDGFGSDGKRILHCFVNGTVLNPKLPLCTGGIFATYPQAFLSLPNGFFDQVSNWYNCEHVNLLVALRV